VPAEEHGETTGSSVREKQAGSTGLAADDLVMAGALAGRFAQGQQWLSRLVSGPA
jgi:hypothetical protein